MKKSFTGFEVLALVPMCTTGARCDRRMPDTIIVGFTCPPARHPFTNSIPLLHTTQTPCFSRQGSMED